ncbi:bifunctional precorrin-2 dehydrogenase/sirohydrochlorin ferrochelatase [Halobaculum sp. MBLA0147]|uniref:precorrin-2 dehydrogenase/sirohydrochlorin ferrochelatase family protein n=1 Tax=Halobaculum sp. MBLA0147 TaxID=3079934 RepID=UPI0035264FD3
MIPLLHDFDGERVLIVGGGAVGARKARTFAREAETVVVSPAFADDDFAGANLIRAAPDPDDLAAWVDRVDPALVVAATDDETVNEAAETAAREHGALVNRADHSGERDPGSVVVPATIRDDPVVVALATGGTAPALSRYLRERLDDEIAGAGEMATVLGTVREELKADEPDPETRRRAITRILESPDVWKALRTEPAKARGEARRIVEEVTG